MAGHYTTKTYSDQGGDRRVIASGGTFLVQSGGIMTVDAGATVGIAAAVALTGALTVTDVNIVLSASTGTKIGTAVSQKLGFWNATPIVQPSAAAQAAITDSTSGSTANATLAAVEATNSGDVSATINANFAKTAVLLNAIRTALVNAGLIKGAA